MYVKIVIGVDMHNSMVTISINIQDYIKLRSLSEKYECEISDLISEAVKEYYDEDYKLLSASTTKH